MRTHRLFPASAFALLSILLAAISLGCQPSTTNSSADSPANNAPAPAEESSPQEVTYEPAYPAEVSTETLDADDTAQQSSHSHSGEEDGGHMHDDSDGHEHGDQGDHDEHGGGHEH